MQWMLLCESEILFMYKSGTQELFQGETQSDWRDDETYINYVLHWNAFVAQVGITIALSDFTLKRRIVAVTPRSRAGFRSTTPSYVLAPIQLWNMLRTTLTVRAHASHNFPFTFFARYFIGPRPRCRFGRSRSRLRHVPQWIQQGNIGNISGLQGK